MRYTYKLHVKSDVRQPFLEFVKQAVNYHVQQYGHKPTLILLPLDCNINDRIAGLPTQILPSIQKDACGLVMQFTQRTPRIINTQRTPMEV